MTLPCHYPLPTQWHSTCHVQSGSPTLLSTLGKSWCSALPSLAYILWHSCGYQGAQTLAPGWLGVVVVIPGEEAEELTSVFLLPSGNYLLRATALAVRDRKRKKEPSLSNILRLPVARCWIVISIWGLHPLATGSDAWLSLFSHSY